MWIAETTDAVTPTAGTWANVYYAKGPIRETIRIVREAKGPGIGARTPLDYIQTKKYAELTIEHDVMKKATWSWADFFANVLGNGGLTVTNHIQSFSLGIKRSLATPEFLLYRGCKIKSYELLGAEGNVVRGRATIWALDPTSAEGTTDYVSGTAVRQAAPTTNEVEVAGCDLKRGATSVIDRLRNFAFTVDHTLELLGHNLSNKFLYRAIAEKERTFTLVADLDFNDKTERTDFINDTQYASWVMDIPTGVGAGHEFTLSNGRIQEAPFEGRAADPLRVPFTLRFPSLTLAAL